MFLIKSERGYALILVLLSIVIIGILVPPIISNVLSSSAQFEKTEESIQRSKLEEMAKKHFEATVLDAISDYETYLESGWSPPPDWEEINQEAYIFNGAITFIEDRLISQYPASPLTFQFDHTNQKFRIIFDEASGIDIDEMTITFLIVTVLNSEESPPQETIIEIPNITIL